MKRALLVIGLAACTLSPAVARAQFVVSDPVTHAIQQLQQVQLVQEVATSLNQLRELEQQLAQLQQTYEALAHVTDLGTAVAALQQLGLVNPLPLDPLAIESMLRGGGAKGFTALLNQLFNANVAANTLGPLPNDGTLGTQQLQAQINSVSGSAALGDTLYQTATNRQTLIEELGQRLNNSATDKDTLDLIARLLTESNVEQNQTTLAVASDIMQQNADKQQALQQAQKVLQSDQQWLRMACGQTGDCNGGAVAVAQNGG